jgi:hypothetical protein
LELSAATTVEDANILENVLESASQSLSENVPGWVESPIQVAAEEVFQPLQENLNPLQENNLNTNLNPLLERELQEQPRYPNVTIQTKYPYIRIKEAWQGRISKQEMIQRIISGIREKLKDFYERPPMNNRGMNLFAMNKYKIQMQAQFYILKPDVVYRDDDDLMARSLKTFPLGQNEKTLIQWNKPSNVAPPGQFIPNMGIQSQEDEDKKSIKKWLDELEEKLNELMDEYLDKLSKDGTGEKEKNYNSIKVDGFRKECTITFLWHGADKPDFEDLLSADVSQKEQMLPPEEDDIIINPNLQQLPNDSDIQINLTGYSEGVGNDSSIRVNMPDGNTDVGCSKTSKEMIYRGSYVLWSTNTKKNRCAIYCVLKKLELGAPVLDEKGSTNVKQRKDDIIKDFLRAQYEKDGSQLTFPMPIKEFYRLAEYFKCWIKLYWWKSETEEMLPLCDQEGEPYEFGEAEDLPIVVRMMIEDGHAYLIVKDKMDAISKKVCPHCRTIYSKTHTNCDQSKIAYLNRRIEKNKKKISASEKFVTNINNNRCIFFDCETFTDERGEHIPYAIGWGIPDETSRSKKRKKEEEPIALIKWEFKYEWGEGCMERFLDWFEKYVEETEKPSKNKKRPKKILIGFNNANYDNLLLSKVCLKMGMDFEFQIQNNALIGMQTEMFRTWDLCRFLPGQSLDSACKNFGASDADAKTHFPHKFIKSWEDLEYIGVEPGAEYHWKAPENWNYVTTPTWNLKETCLKYLEKDIRGTIFVFNKLQETCFQALHVDIKEFITASHMSFDVWTNLVSNASKETNRFNPLENRKEIFELYFPTAEQEDVFRQAIYGGRTYNTSRDYESVYYQRLVNGEKIPYDDIDDWMDVFDVVSLYASAMLFNKYPCGLAQNSTEEELAIVSSLTDQHDYDEIPLGIYKVKYITNKKLIIPALPRKTFRREANGSIISQGLIWDLEDSEGYYTTVDIIEARKQGYEFEFLAGIQWPEKGAIFEKYIELALELKCKGEEEGNETLRSLGKLLCNALYGKMLQRPILESSALVKDSADLEKFLATNNLTDIIFLNDKDDRLLVVGEECQRELKIRKPSYIGAFVLSYSRKIMHNFAGMADPWRGTSEIQKSIDNSFLYTDTDSLFYKTTPHILEALKPVLKENQPGNLWYDLKGKPAPKVLKAIFLGPKTYLLIYYTKDGKLCSKMRSKGIPSSFLTQQDYFNLLEMSQVERKDVPQIRKVMHSKKEQIPFTLIATNVQKCLMKELWKGRFFTSSQTSYPFGHESLPFLQNVDK